MHSTSYNEMARLVATYLSREKPLRILDVGSCSVDGGSYRPLFQVPGWTYEGADVHAGPNVDIVLSDLYEWKLPVQYDVIVSGQTFEHIEFFWFTWQRMVDHLKPGGFLFLIAPSSGNEHRYPVDCWRFYADGMRALAKLGKLEVLEAKTLTEGAWKDTVGAFRKGE